MTFESLYAEVEERYPAEFDEDFQSYDPDREYERWLETNVDSDEYFDTDILDYDRDISGEWDIDEDIPF